MAQLLCPVCRRPAVQGRTHLACKKRSGLDGLTSSYQYQGLIKRVIAKFKYKFVSDLSQTLIELWLSDAKLAELPPAVWTIVPIPLHKSRLRWRGFNQAQILAEGLAANWQWPINSRLLIRCRPTQPQMTMARAGREHNLTKAFQVGSGIKIPENILLVDDVATTGTTLNQAAKALKQAGAKQVWGLTLAQTPFST